MKQLFLLTLLIILITSTTIAQKETLVDKNATAETKALFKNLKELSNKHTLFGHQHATEYGHGWSGDENRSDVKSVTGSHPAVIGVDLSGFSGRSPESVEKAKKDVGKIVSDTYNRGGVITIALAFFKSGIGRWFLLERFCFPTGRYIYNSGRQCP